MVFGSKRSRIAPVLVALLVLLAGCSGIIDSGGGESPTETTESPSPTDASGETTGETATGNESTTDNGTTDDRTAAMTGRLLVAMEGEDTHFADADSAESEFWINESQEHTWHASTESVTLADALESIGIEASADSLTYDGTTYRESEANTSVGYRVDGEVVKNPSEHELESDDLVTVQVNTGDRETPGREVSTEHPHPHGTFEVTVNGEQKNLTGEEYTMADPYFHFHGDEGAERWHGHSVNLTVDYAVSTFPDMNLTEESLTYDGTTYDREDATVNVTVNGEPVDTGTYVLKDGDDVRVEISEE